jgi:CRP/FNR family transcriptional regulator
MNTRTIEILRRIQLFSSFDDDELRHLGSVMPVREYRKGRVILHEEDTNEFMYVVMDGKVKVARNTEDGREIILAFHGAGEFFGEMTLIDGKTMPATVSAMEDSLIAVISRGDFNALLLTQSKFVEKLIHILCSRLRDSWKQIEMLNFNTASHRIKMLLRTLADKDGRETPDGIALELKLTHRNIADMTGLTRETVTRVLDGWQKDGDMSVPEKGCLLLGRSFFKNI